MRRWLGLYLGLVLAACGGGGSREVDYDAPRPDSRGGRGDAAGPDGGGGGTPDARGTLDAASPDAPSTTSVIDAARPDAPRQDAAPPLDAPFAPDATP